MIIRLIIIGFMILIPIDSYAQTLVDIIRSDRQQRTQTADGFIQKLTGNVKLQTPDVSIEADSAWHYIELGEIHGFGNLRIETERETIWADKIIYDIDAEISSLTGNVIIRTPSADIYSATALYSFLTEIALFNDPIWMKDENGVLQANDGVYFSQSDSAIFRGNVQLADSTQYIEADSMFTNRATEDYKLYGNVYLQDDENRSRITGDYVEADSTGRRLIDGNSVLMRVSADLSDTTWLWSDKINITKIDTFYITDAQGDVQLWENKYASRSDSSRYDEQQELIELRTNPVVWYEDIELNGDEIDIQLRNDTLETLKAIGNPFAAQRDSLTARLHQMSGDILTVFFEDDQVDKIHIYDNAELLLHATDSNDDPDGAINVRGSKIYIYFEDGDVDRMRVEENVDGLALDESPDLEQMQIPGFRWAPERRPQRPESEILPRLPPVTLTPPFTRHGVEPRTSFE